MASFHTKMPVLMCFHAALKSSSSVYSEDLKTPPSRYLCFFSFRYKITENGDPQLKGNMILIELCRHLSSQRGLHRLLDWIVDHFSITLAWLSLQFPQHMGNTEVWGQGTVSQSTPSSCQFPYIADPASRMAIWKGVCFSNLLDEFMKFPPLSLFLSKSSKSSLPTRKHAFHLSCEVYFEFPASNSAQIHSAKPWVKLVKFQFHICITCTDRLYICILYIYTYTYIVHIYMLQV